METNNKLTRFFIPGLMAAAVILSLLGISFSEKLTSLLGGSGVRMQYESELFDTSQIISIDIQMQDEQWDNMLANALAEEYYTCDVVVNGTKFTNVAIRPKGNTSLSAIAMDPDTDRFSLKLEFDHYVKGQTCFGLDKLILNNNYADATNMKETVVYDMYQYLEADASLYNYAKISVNGEYTGIYLALEGVEDSFMLRNYGTQDGELYKPESMGMGGGANGSSGMNPPGGVDFSNMDFSNMNFSNLPSGENMTPPSDASGFGPSSGDSASGTAGMTPPSDASGFEPSSGDSASGTAGMTPPSRDFDPGAMGGFSMGGGGANLNYTDDETDSYSTIWEGSVTNTGKKDHKRVITALKNISEGTDLETYMDVDNILRYMAVHTFSVNMDSLSGSMAHNYYLYEYNGQLNMIPWDYNLSFGGMNMGASGGSSEMINDAIDSPFPSTTFFDGLLNHEEYLNKYHEYLQQLVDEYVFGGRFEELYNRTREEIDTLVETDPTAFYTYDEYLTAAEMLYKTVQLRAESIQGQLDGSIPSTDAGQRQDSTSLIDASEIDIRIMGVFSMGGFGGDNANDGGFGGFGGFGGSKAGNPGSFDGDHIGAPDADLSSTAPESGENASVPAISDMFQRTKSTVSRTKNLMTYGICLAVMLLSLICLRFYKRRH